MGAVHHGLMINEGKDPNVINLDKTTLSSQQQSKTKEIRHEIGEPKLAENSLWDQATKQSSIQLDGVDIDKEEVASLISPLNKSQGAASAESQPSSNQKVQLIDGRRRMNGPKVCGKLCLVLSSIAIL